MAATYPAVHNDRDMFLPAHISRHNVRIGDMEFNGDNKHWIAKHGIVLQPGGENGINQLTVTFFVGQVDIDDDALAEIRVEPAGTL